MAATVGNAIGFVSAGKKAKQGEAMERQGKAGIENFQWQDIDASIPIATEGSDIIARENARTSATSIDSLQASGVRGVVGGAGQIQEANNNMNAEAQRYMDDQLINKAYTKLKMTEGRQANELQGYGQMMNVGMGMKYQGRADQMNIGRAQSEHAMSVASSIATMGASGGNGGGGPQSAEEQQASQIQTPQGGGFQQPNWDDPNYGSANWGSMGVS